MKKMIFFGKHIIAMLLVLLSLASCNPKVEDKPDTVAVSGIGTMRARPDMARISIGFAHTAPTTQEAKKSVEQTMQAILKVLQDENIEAKDLKTASLSYRTDYEYRNGRRVRLGQKAEQNVEITLKNLVENAGRFAALLDKIAVIDKVEINDIRFDIDRKAELFRKSRELAYNKAYEKAGQYAALCGRKIGKVIAITENRNQDVEEAVLNMRANRVEESCDAANASTVPTGENEIMTEVQVVFSLK